MNHPLGQHYLTEQLTDSGFIFIFLGLFFITPRHMAADPRGGGEECQESTLAVSSQLAS